MNAEEELSPEEKITRLNEVNQNLNQALDDMHSLRDDSRRLMGMTSEEKIFEVFTEVLCKILKITTADCVYYNAVSADGPYQLHYNAEGLQESEEELFVDFEMIDFLNQELKPVQFQRENNTEIWIPLVRNQEILGITQVFIKDKADWDLRVEDRVLMFSDTAAASLQSIRVSSMLESQGSRFKTLLEVVKVVWISKSFGNIQSLWEPALKSWQKIQASPHPKNFSSVV